MDRPARRGLKLIAALLLGALTLPALAQSSNEDVHAAERARFGFGELRPGANGNDPDAPNAANTVEALVGSYTLPPLFESEAQRTPAAWPARREDLARLVEDNWVGRIPEVVEDFRIEWNKVPVVRADMLDYAEDAFVEDWKGRVIAPDGRSGPVVDATIYFPKSRENLPAFVSYTYVWPENFNLAALGGGDGPQPPDAIRMALDNGWAYVDYRPQMLQADNAAQMEEGVIGLARWPRERHDWGALRAWAWGASQLREELASDTRINGERISLTGHSRFGKGVLVAAAFDHAFHDAQVSSSGAGGAKLMRRDFGERWENLTGSGEFYWLTPQAMYFSTEERSVHDLPIDAHSLIALRAPRPLFITSGRADKGDSWVDPAGMWTAYAAAQPAWDLFGTPIPRSGMPVSESTEQAWDPLGWYQHGEGHVAWPAFDEFYRHAERYFED